MKLPNEKIVGGTSGYAEAVAEEEKPGFRAILVERLGRPRSMCGWRSVRQLSILLGLPEIQAIFIDKREAIESCDRCLRNL